MLCFLFGLHMPFNNWSVERSLVTFKVLVETHSDSATPPSQMGSECIKFADVCWFNSNFLLVAFWEQVPGIENLKHSNIAFQVASVDSSTGIKICCLIEEQIPLVVTHPPPQCILDRILSPSSFPTKVS